jgi:hypothetical protein
MLVKFDSPVGTFIMDRGIAVELLKAMGHSGTVPSAILAADIPDALARLKAVVAASPKTPAEAPDSNDKNPIDVPVSLRQRAFPLIDLLARAAARGAEVMWTNAR